MKRMCPNCKKSTLHSTLVSGYNSDDETILNGKMNYRCRLCNKIFSFSEILLVEEEENVSR